MKSTRCHVDVLLQGDLISTRWCPCVPIRINVFIWRVLHDRIPTRVTLDDKGVELPSILCPLCSMGVENSNNVFVLCEVANQGWLKVFKWLDLPFPLFLYVVELLSLVVTNS